MRRIRQAPARPPSVHCGRVEQAWAREGHQSVSLARYNLNFLVHSCVMDVGLHIHFWLRRDEVVALYISSMETRGPFQLFANPFLFSMRTGWNNHSG
eukprot:14672894-Alexandrium_andersonii.AAC.1